MGRAGSGGGQGRPRTSRRSGGFISVGIVLALTAGLVATVLGAGAFSRTLDVADGNVWLWSSKPGQVSRVNANSGRVDLNQPATDARGHHIQVVQNDRYLLLHDLDSGKVTSVDLTRMGFTGTLDVGKGSNYTVALSGNKAAVIDLTKGLVRGIDPANLRVTGARLQLPGPLVGGTFDAAGALWLGVRSQGTVVSVDLAAGKASVSRTESVLDPGRDMAITVLDHGVLALDRSGTSLAVVGDSVRRATAPEPLTGATLPARTVGGLAAITLPRTNRVIAVNGLGKDEKVAAFALPGNVKPNPAAMPFGGRIYVPDSTQHLVYVYDSSGRRLDALGLAGAEGPLQLEVIDDHLMVNAPDSSIARIIDADGVTRIVNKYRTDVPGGNGDVSLIAAPAPGTKTNSPAGQQDNNPPQIGPPSPPIPVTALAGNHQVVVSWPQPAANGADITRYDVSWNGGHRQLGGGTNSLTATGLHNGTSYSFSVTATNKYGTSPPALSDNVVPDSNLPDTPTGVNAAAQNDGSVKVTWQKSDGASSYVVQSSPASSGGSFASEGGNPTATVPAGALTYGRSYTFTVVAKKSTGTASAPSAPSNPVTPYSKPGAPTDPSAHQTAGDKWAVTWGRAPENGKAISNYVIKVNGSEVAKPAANATSADVTGNFSGSPTFSITAVNAAGEGDAATTRGKPASKPTVSITDKSADNNSLTVHFKVDWGGVAAGSCKLSVSGAGSANGCGGSLTVGNLKSNTDYSFTVTATSSMGDGSAGGSVRTSGSVEAVISCTNPKGDNYCDGNIGVYPTPNQDDVSRRLRKMSPGTRFSATCKAHGNRTLKAAQYNGNKTSDWWVRIEGGQEAYVPWIWTTLDGGDNINALPNC